MSNAHGEDTPTEAVANPAVDAISNIRLPAFWRQSPEFWFTHIESVFVNQRIRSNAAKVNFVVGALDEEGVQTVGDLLGPSASYDTICVRLIDAYELPKSVRFREIVKPGSIGDHHPSQCLTTCRLALERTR
jgi:hypothetical protein